MPTTLGGSTAHVPPRSIADARSDPALVEDAGHLSRALNELIRVVQFRDRDRACCYGISVSQCYALMGVAGAGALTVNDLAAHLYLDKSTASRIANGLVDKGLLARDRDSGDGRVVHLVATVEGRSVCSNIETKLLTEYADMLGDFDPEIRAATTRLVARLGRSFASRVEASGGSCCVVNGDIQHMTAHARGDVKKAVRDRYAQAATESTGCCEPSCCDGSSGVTADESIQSIGYSAAELEGIPADANLGLGCGNPTAIASLTEGQTVLDLGSGAGIDCFLASKQVGPTGRVIGVDMTPEMLERARAHAESGGYDNVDFRLGEIEALPVADESVDVIISNCVLNLSPAKDQVLAEAYRVLKPGGRMVISDLVSDCPVPAILEGNLDAVAACLPTFRESYLQHFREAGFAEVRITDERPYPTSLILEDAGVRDFVQQHPGERAELMKFASSIAGAHFEATRA